MKAGVETSYPAIPKLSDTAIRAAKAREKPYKLFDAEGLFLIVHPKGGRK